MNDGDQHEPTDPTGFPPPGGDDTPPVGATEPPEPAAAAPDDTTPVAAAPVTEPVTEPVAATAVDEPTAPVSAAPAPAPAEPAPRKGVLVPVWALATVGSLVLLLVGGLVGYAIGNDDSGNDRAATGIVRPGNGTALPDFGNFGPFGGNGNGNSGGNGNGNGNSGGNGNGNGGGNSGGNGNGPSAPSGNGAFLGVAVRDSSDPAGAALVRVVDDSPADDAELETGDVITEVDGRAVADAAALTERIGALDVGDTVRITYSRDGKSTTVRVTLGDRTPTSTQ